MKEATKLFTAFIVFTAAASLSADDKKMPSVPGVPDAVMAQAMQMGTPGVNHQLLASIIGKWTCTVHTWMKADDKGQESKGSAENTMALGGRFLKQDFKGNFAGQQFEGTGYTGFDNMRGEFDSIWLDNMSTGIMESSGTYDAVMKTINLTGAFSCPITGEKSRWVRSQVKFVDADTYVYSSYFKGPDTNEFKSMEITYKRTK